LWPCHWAEIFSNPNLQLATTGGEPHHLDHRNLHSSDQVSKDLIASQPEDMTGPASLPVSITSSVDSGTHAPLRAEVVIKGSPQLGKNFYLHSDAHTILHRYDAALNIIAALSPL
jgi:hypothetical protein